MPIYEFICQDCGYEFERIQSFSETTMPSCPRCEQVNVMRRVGRPAIHFKGSGWYITDSKNGAKRNATNGSKDDGADSARSDSSSSSKTESSSEKSKAPASATASTE